MKDDEFKNIDFTFDPIFSCANIRYDINSIVNKLIQESEMQNEAVVKSIILNQHALIFKYDNLVNNNRESVQKLFSDDIAIFFLNILESVVGLLKLSTEEIKFINKLIYDFFEHTKNYYNSELESDIKEKLLSISYTINADRIRKLSAIIGINNAKLLSIISYSSFIDEKIVHRVNDFVVSNIRLTVSELFLIYDIIFDIDIMDLSTKGKNYIIYSMLEYWENEGHNVEEYKMFKNISDMILNILNTIYTVDIVLLYSLFEEYSNMIKLFNINKTRFSFHNISDIKWVKIVLKDLESKDIYIP